MRMNSDTRNAHTASLPDPTAVSANEFNKSGATRERILNAARDLLVDQGYHRFTTGSVAARANLTRAAMLYHFPNRQDLVTAVVHHLARRRIQQFEAVFEGIALEPVALDGPEFRNLVARAANWHIDTPENVAFAELQHAARTDAELAPVVTRGLTAVDSARRAIFEQMASFRNFDPDYLQLLRDVFRLLSEGLMHSDLLAESMDKRRDILRHFLLSLLASPRGRKFVRESYDEYRDSAESAEAVSEMANGER